MDGLNLKNSTGRKLTLIVEPIAEEYAFAAGDLLELRPPLYLGSSEVIDVEFTGDYVVVYADEDVSITRDGKPVPCENLA